MTIWALPALAASLAVPTIASMAMVEVEPPATVPTTDLEAVAPDLADPATEVLDLDADRHSRYTVPVMIDGAGPYDFMVDTGSQATAVTSHVNDGIGLRPSGTATLVGMASQRSVDLVEVNSMSFGSTTIRDITSPVLERQHVGADGIIGLDSLQDLRVLINFRDETIAVQDVTHLRGEDRRGFEIIVRARQELGQLLITNAYVEGVRATVIIDTGAQMSLGNLALRERIRSKRAEEIRSTDVNGVTLVGELTRVRSLNFEGISLTNVPLTFADTPAFAALGLQDQPVLALGMEHLRLFDRVAIDFASQRVLFDVPRDLARALRRRSRALRVPLQ